MNRSRALTTARLVSWTIAIGAVLAVALGYDTLPAVLPVSRWTEAPKTWLLALRIPAINLCTLGLVEAFCRCLVRTGAEARLRWSAAILLSTAGAKSLIECLELLVLPKHNGVSPVVLVAFVLAGLAATWWFARAPLAGGERQKLRMTTAEQFVCGVLIVCIVVLNLPHVTN